MNRTASKYKNRLSYIGDKSYIFEELSKYNEDQTVYVYKIYFQDDPVLTGEYFQNWGMLYGDKRDDWFINGDKHLEFKDGSGWNIYQMTAKEFKEFIIADKIIQDDLDNKYPYLINGGKYGYVW